jgi:hypothetical protein
VSAPEVTRQMVLRRAAEILTANGRTINEFWDREQYDAGTPIEACRVCVNTAIALAAGADPAEFADLSVALGFATPEEKLAVSAVRAVSQHLGLVVDPNDPITTLYHWHDGYDGDTPTDEQVLAALTETADDLDQLTEV